MKLFAVTMVKDERDILPYTFSHLVSEGVDGILLCDNGSTDGTREWIVEMVVRREPVDWADPTVLSQPPPHPTVELVIDDEVAYYQSAKMTALAERAFSRGADWVIPFDADECWYSADGRSLAQVFRDAPVGVDGLAAKLHNYFPTSGDDPTEPNPYRRIIHRGPEPAPLPKVATSYRGVTIEQGNHGISGDRELVVTSSSLVVGHFPWRSPKQFERKVRNGSRAYAATTLPESMGGHWRSYGRILDEGGPEALRAVYDQWFHDPDMDLEPHPVPWSRFATGNE